MMPEYEIHPNMRLVDVIETPPHMFLEASRFHLDFVIWDNERKIIAAIELDDSTHDTIKAQARDAKKDAWLNQARIKLIRIRSLQEISSIRTQIREFEFPTTENKSMSLDERDYTYNPKQFRGSKTNFQNKTNEEIYAQAIGKAKKEGKSLLASIAFAGFMGLALYFGTQAIFKNMGKNVIAQQQKLQQENQQRTNAQRAAIEQAKAQEAWYKQQELEKAEIRKRIETQQPHYERVFVKAKSPTECKRSDGVITDQVIWCMKNHYEKVWVSGNQ